MTKPYIQIDDLVREMTDEEHEAYLAELAKEEINKAEQKAREQARKSALAKLAGLGLTEEEIAAL
jgi:hypothetical protein